MSEQPLTIQSGPIALEGALHLPPGRGPHPGIVVCHPHPLYGGDMGNNVVAAIVRGVTERGIAALRFNFRGVGASTGEHDKGQGELADVASALACLRGRSEIDPARTGLAGYSFGASMALGAAPRDAGLAALAVVAPPAPGLNAPAILAWAKPKYILAGDADRFIPIEEVHEMTRRMAQPLTIDVLHGADHFMGGYEAEIARRVGEFFAKALKS